MDFSTRPVASRPGWPALLLLCASAGLAALAGLEARGALRERAVNRAAVDSLRQQLGAARRQLTALDSRRRGDGERLAARARLTVEAPPHRVLSDLAALLPPDVRLAGLTLVYDGQLRVEAQVVARHAAAYDAFLDRLVASRRFSGVLPGPESREGELRASLRASYRAETAP